MPVPADQFKDGMRRLAAAVNVVTTASDQERLGMTVTAVMSLTADPPQLGIAINRSARSFALIQSSGCFAVNVLSSDQAEIGAAFAGQGGVTGEARFAFGTWVAGRTGAPLLEDSVATFDCRVVQEVDLGTHTLFVGLVEAVRVKADGTPLIYVEGAWRSLDRRHVTGQAVAEEAESPERSRRISDADGFVASE